METKEQRNAWVELRYDALMAEGKHGHYETLFRVVREAVAAEREECAKLADAWSDLSSYAAGVVAGAKIAEVIRERQP